jgi:hypothetical protein
MTMTRLFCDRRLSDRRLSDRRLSDPTFVRPRHLSVHHICPTKTKCVICATYTKCVICPTQRLSDPTFVRPNVSPTQCLSDLMLVQKVIKMSVPPSVCPSVYHFYFSFRRNKKCYLLTLEITHFYTTSEVHVLSYPNLAKPSLT